MKTITVATKVTEAEHALIRERASDSLMTIQEYARRRLLGASMNVMDELPDISKRKVNETQMEDV